MSKLIKPRERANQIGRAALEASFAKTMAAGALSHGWIIAGGVGAGKATLAYRMARSALAPKSRRDGVSFETDEQHSAFKLIAQGAHPDLFVAERLWNEKTSKFQTEITVETIRKLTHFLSHTPALGGARVAIVDTADDLNRNAANALLKVLEEPPRDTLLLLLSAAPGRLLATIRSRCRRIDLRPIDRAEICALLEQEGVAAGEQAARIADHADGRPGYALKLAAEGGAEMITLAEAFLKAGRRNGDVAAVASKFSARTSAEEWGVFITAIVNGLTDAARTAGRGEPIAGPLANASAPALIEAWERLSKIALRGEALNLDRAQIIGAMGHDLNDIVGAA